MSLNCFTAATGCCCGLPEERTGGKHWVEVDKGENGKLCHSLFPLLISFLFFSIHQSPLPATIFDPRAHLSPVSISVFYPFFPF